MAESGTLIDAFVDGLHDIYDAERQLVRALPKLIKAATNTRLRDAFEKHVKETVEHAARLEHIFVSLDQTVRGSRCEGMAGIIEEAASIMEDDFNEITMDASLIGVARRVEHYEIAAYGTLTAWAEVMGRAEAARLLRETLEEEKRVCEVLSILAQGGIDYGAAHGFRRPSLDSEEVSVAVRTTRKAARRA